MLGVLTERSRFYSGYEYTRRRFQAKYKNVPVWALLASGSCGGVRGDLIDFTSISTLTVPDAIAIVLVGMLPVRYLVVLFFVP